MTSKRELITDRTATHSKLITESNDPLKVPRDHVKDAHVSTAYTEGCSVSLLTSFKMTEARDLRRSACMWPLVIERNEKRNGYIFRPVNARQPFETRPCNPSTDRAPWFSPGYFPSLSLRVTQRRRSRPA